MKKLIVICLSFVMLFTMSITAFAASGMFISSPSGKKAPHLVGYMNGSPDCAVEIRVTPYSERDTLRDADREMIEFAYDQIVNSVNESNDFYVAVENLAKDMEMSPSSLSVSDLYDISAYGCTEEAHAHHLGTTITLQSETFENFVGMLHLYNGEWQNVEILEYDKENNTITFYIEEFSPFAILVDNEGGGMPPKTNDMNNAYVWIMLAAAAGFVLVLANMKKQTA